MNPDDPGESAVIALLARAGLAAAHVQRGIGDDAAVVDGQTVLTCDTMVEGVHWDDRLDAADVGWKLVAVNVSDVGAMGGVPRWALLALTLPRPLDLDWVRGFADGVVEACAYWSVPLVGGDTTRGPARIVTLSVGGHAPRPVGRDGARPGDDLWIAGPLGLAAEAMLSPSPSASALAWLRRPRPPVGLGAAIAPHVHAMMDVSDGLRTDLARLCRASGVGADVTSAAIAGVGPIGWRIAYGDDYALLMAAPPSARDALCSAADMFGTPLARIGVVTAGAAPTLDGQPVWPAPLFGHFAGSAS